MPRWWRGRSPALAASGRAGGRPAVAARRASGRWCRAALAAAFALREEVARLAGARTVVCRCEDVGFDRMKNFAGWREAKLQTRCGMRPCQGRVCGAAARVLFGWGMESVRPPVLPGRVESLCQEGTGFLRAWGGGWGKPLQIGKNSQGACHNPPRIFLRTGVDFIT